MKSFFYRELECIKWRINLQSIIDSLSEKQRRDLIVVDDWNRTLNMGRGLRTGRYLAQKGLVKDTGEMYNYSTRWIITDLGKRVAEKLNKKT